MKIFEDMIRRGGTAAIEKAGLFFMGADPVHQTTAKHHATAR
jgi:hypothetical protein